MNKKENQTFKSHNRLGKFEVKVYFSMNKVKNDAHLGTHYYAYVISLFSEIIISDFDILKIL